MAWLILVDTNVYHFNMHLLFPEQFPETDPLGHENWNHDWFCAKTGSKWSPNVVVDLGGADDVTILLYDTAWSPNNGTLQRLHEKTGWTICNDYIEEGAQMCGRFTCDNGDCHDEDQEYMTSCEICEKRKPEEEFDEEQDGLICNACRETKTTS